MKIKHTWRKGEVVSISDAVESRIRAYDGGAIENASDTANQMVAEFGKLIELLHTKGVMSDEEVKKFIGYEYSVEE